MSASPFVFSLLHDDRTRKRGKVVKFPPAISALILNRSLSLRGELPGILGAIARVDESVRIGCDRLRFLIVDDHTHMRRITTYFGARPPAA